MRSGRQNWGSESKIRGYCCSYCQRATAEVFITMGGQFFELAVKLTIVRLRALMLFSVHALLLTQHPRCRRLCNIIGQAHICVKGIHFLSTAAPDPLTHLTARLAATSAAVLLPAPALPIFAHLMCSPSFSLSSYIYMCTLRGTCQRGNEFAQAVLTWQHAQCQ